MLKKLLLGLGLLVLVLALVVGATALTIFGGQKEMVDGQVLGGEARLVKEGFVAAYVLPAGGGMAVLIDCGNEPDAAPVIAQLKKLGLGPEAVKAIFLTHGHGDHTGGCHRFTGADVYAFPEDKALAEGTGQARGLLTRFFTTPKERTIHVSQTLVDGQTISLGTVALRAFAVPGHTGGSAAFLASGVLYLGDSAGINSDGSVRPAPSLFSDDPAQNRASLQRLAERLRGEHLEVKQLACAHSGVGEGLEPLAKYKP